MQTRHLVGFPSDRTALSAALMVTGFAFFVGCAATGGGGEGGSASATNAGSGSNSGSGSTTAAIYFGTNVSGGGPECTDPDCMGSKPQGDCDGDLAIDNADGFNGAKAMGLCKRYEEGGWGIKSAEYIRSNGSPLTGIGEDGLFSPGKARSLGRGNLAKFGPLGPREGARMLALSTGVARDPDDAGYEDGPGIWRDSSAEPGTPDGFPKGTPACPGVTAGDPYDSAGLKVVIKTPRDAKSFSFNLNFYTFEFPIFICQQYNDFFVALVDPKPEGAPDGNVSFDTEHNHISVNAGLLQVCSPQTAGGRAYSCPNGMGDLAGTGFEGHAATGWLETTVPIAEPGKDITLIFHIWDSGDGSYDSTILIDNFTFQLGEAQTGTVVVPG